MTQTTHSQSGPWLDPAPSSPRPALPGELSRSRGHRGPGPQAGRWSFRIATLFGIDLNIHATFLLLLVWIAASHLAEGHDLATAGAGVGLVLAVFATVVLHELGHALTARRFGIRTRDITLLPIGGISSLERMPEKPSQELLVALAGPAVNFVLALALAGLIALTGGSLSADLPVVGGPLLPKLLWINISLGVFNLLPAFPMDGGRVLRAMLALRIDYVRATRIAARVGRVMAVAFALLGLFGNPMLLLIAFFVWAGALEESSLVQVKSALEGLPVQSAMRTDFSTLAPDTPLATAVELILAGSQHDFPVVENQRVLGVLTRADVVKGLMQGGPQLRVERVMHQDFVTAEPNELLEPTLARFAQSQGAPIMVLQEGRLVGLLGSENVGELVLMQSALRGQPGPRAS
jgi:Zn-dependent protease/CBS domain-containing protein